MSAFTFMVSVETERDSGLHASRDEQSDAIAEALAEVEGNITISGIGPRSDSDYSVSSFEVNEYELKAVKAINAEYELKVEAAAPPISETTKQLRETKAALKAAQNQISQLERKLAKITEEKEAKATSVWQGSWDEPKTYLEDGRYDKVFFGVGEDKLSDRSTLSIRRLDKAESPSGRVTLEITHEGWGGEMGIKPRSANQFWLTFDERG